LLLAAQAAQVWVRSMSLVLLAVASLLVAHSLHTLVALAGQ
jgi:hypothetical protein